MSGLPKHLKEEANDGVWACSECGTEFHIERVPAITQHYYKRHTLDTKGYFERYERIKTEIPDRYVDIYEDLTGHGQAPKIVQAAICYIESSCTQSEAAKAFDTTEVSIRRTVERMVDNNVVTLEYVRENCVANGDKLFGRRTAGERKWKPS